MNYEKLETLSRIYNTLLLVNTKGEDTLIMADCLNALRSFMNNEQRELQLKANIQQETENFEEE